MNQSYPVPPPELVEQLRSSSGTWLYQITKAYQAGADQELEACCKWLPKLPPWSADDLRRHRRPKPPSLKEQALEQLDQISTCFRISHGGPIVCDKILRALEALPND